MISKKSYPQPGGSIPQASRDLSKWVQTADRIYRLSNTIPYSQALSSVISSWDDMEKQDFQNWLKFYQEGNDKKYSIAQTIPLHSLKANIPGMPIPQELDSKVLVDSKIKSIISRLSAAERLATSDFQVVQALQQRLGMGVDKWLQLLHDLKRQIQTAPLRHASSIDDLMIKKANILRRDGLTYAAETIERLAQETPPAQPKEEESPLNKFIKNMNLDSSDTEDTSEIRDMEEDPISDMKIIAQQMPIMPSEDVPAVPEAEAVIPDVPAKAMPKPVPQPMPQTEVDIPVDVPADIPIEVESPEVADTILDQKTDDILDAALEKITVHDVITRLEALANIFRTREIPRQLAIIDLMMDRLNISAFFPSLAEASSKSLESNQYSLTRVEEILSKLRGTIKTPKSEELDLMGDQDEQGGLVQQLKEQKDKEIAKKERRKQQEEAAEQLLEVPQASEVVLPAPETPIPAPKAIPKAVPVA